MTTVINLKDLRKPAAFAIVDEDGARHEMKPTTVEAFIENVELIEKLGVNPSTADEVKAMITIITRAFPTLTEQVVKLWPLENLIAISDIARGQGGEIVTTDAEKAAEAEATGNA